MKKTYQILLGCWPIFFLIGCLPDPLEVEGVPAPEEQIVVGSQLIPNQFIAISLTKNFTALEAGPNSDPETILADLLVPDIEATITVENESYPLEELLEGIYATNDLPQEPGTRYTLSFINPINKDSTFAQATALPYIGFSTLVPELDYTAFDSLLRIQFSIQDPPGPNWYMINAQRVGSSIDLTRRPYTKLYTDEGLDGQLIEDRFTVPFSDFSEQDTVLISVANISQEYFDFLELRGDQQFLLLGELGEPVNYPTNVVNGLGFFNVYLPDIRLFILDDL